MRSRSLKPGFFKNEVLAALGPYAQLLFEGLWCLADREGRLEDRPKRIKADTLPYFDVDVDEILDLLVSERFIVRYEVEGLRCIWIPTFKLHQNPHKNEKPSILPACDVIAKRPDTLQKCTNLLGLTPSSLTPDSGLLTPCLSEGSAASGDSPVDNFGGDEFADIDFGDEEEEPQAQHSEAQKLTAFYAAETKRVSRCVPKQKDTDAIAGIIAERLKAGRDPALIRAAITKLVREGKPAAVLKTLIEEAFQTAPRSTFPPGASPPSPADVAASAKAASASRAAFEASKQAVAP